MASPPPSVRLRTREAGVTVPLFSLRSSRDFGIGEIGDLPRFAEWVKDAGFRTVQLLPSFELAAGETSPYGARTAFGLDPLFVSLADIPDLDGQSIGQALGSDGAAELEKLRARSSVDYDGVRRVKERVLAAAFERFRAHELAHDTPRAKEFRRFAHDAGAWLEDLALYVAIRNSREQHGWSIWPDGERKRDRATLEAARKHHERALEEYRYRQFLAHEQWMNARAKMNELGVALMGDLPFIVGSESADVWSHPKEFRADVSLGAPPDAYSDEGQDWGLPAYDFERMEQDGFGWLKARTRRAIELYDRFRIDHVVGYFRQWVKPKNARRGYFDVPSERMQKKRGRLLLETMREVAGEGTIIAEDLGVIPDWVRSTLKDLGIPGYRILPWERDGDVVRDPRAFPPLSVASWSTHDTAPIALWWQEMTAGDRAGLAKVMNVAEHADRDALYVAFMKTLFGSGSALALVLAQEILGEDERINLPGTVGPANWTYRMRTSIDRLTSDENVKKRTDTARTLLREAGR